MTTSRKIFAAALLVAVLQSSALYAMIEKRAAILRDGKTIVLLTEPVDPRDLLRGDYVRLGYDISSVPGEAFPSHDPEIPTGSDVYVSVKPDASGQFQFARAAFRPLEKLADGEVMLKGKTVFGITGDLPANIPVLYGIERYYVPEGEGMAIEEAQRERRIEAVIAVSEEGAAQIRALRDNGKELYKEPLY
ncbi:MAG: GDYXXLXY domain-containing protein [Phyllobacterium sp.]